MRRKKERRKMIEKLPGDPVLMLGVVNTKLRDFYRDLDDLCDDMQVDKAQITNVLKGIDYEYDRSRNQFV